MSHQRRFETTGAAMTRRMFASGLAASAIIPLDPVLALPAPSPVMVVINTALGRIEAMIDVARAPETAGRFVELVNRKLYDGGSFFRAVRSDVDIKPIKIDVLQGGVAALKHLPMLPAIPHETTAATGIRHLDGTLSTARAQVGTGNPANFFICIGDQPSLDFGGKRNPDGQGFAAFGRVVHGMDVVRRIWTLPVKTSGTETPSELLAAPVLIKHVRLYAVRSWNKDL